jgi:lipopolysaccharide/colanic/teichoic acid biosynthesis glycosyltransferase
LKYRNEEALLAAGPALEEMYYRIMQDKLTLELTYLRKRSFALDLKILFQTVLALFR